MVSSLEVTVSTDGAKLSLEGPISVAFTLLYSGSAPRKVLGFAAEAGREAVEITLDHEELEAGWKGVCRLTGATLRMPKKEGERPKVALSCLLARDDTREAGELLAFLLSSSAALELELRAVVVQAPLPFPSEDEGPLPGERGSS